MMQKNDTLVFCTLFDSNYLDKGIVLYRSLEAECASFRFYVFAFDKKAHEVLVDLSLDNVILISINDIETPEMREIKKSRSMAEYCWTCTPIIIEYVIETFKENHCTYLDSDLFFYASPAVLTDEMIAQKASVLLTPHNYYNCLENRLDSKNKGKYCVQFNTFVNDENGRAVLKWWKQKCMEKCSAQVEKDSFGDQKYLDYFERFEGVCASSSPGGIGPWNLAKYKGINGSDKGKFLYHKKNKEWDQIVFFHFHNVRFIADNVADIRTFVRPGRADKRTVTALYEPYLKQLQKTRDSLNEKYGIEFENKSGKQLPKAKKTRDAEENKSPLWLRGILWFRRYYRHLLFGKKDIIRLQ